MVSQKKTGIIDVLDKIFKNFSLRHKFLDINKKWDKKYSKIFLEHREKNPRNPFSKKKFNFLKNCWKNV